MTGIYGQWRERRKNFFLETSALISRVARVLLQSIARHVMNTDVFCALPVARNLVYLKAHTVVPPQFVCER